MMTFVVAAVDDRQIKTGGRTIETRRRLGGCGLCVTGRRFLRRSNGSFRRSRTLRQHRWHRHHQPSLPRAATSKPERGTQPTNFLPTNSLPPHSRLSDRSTWPGIPR